MKGVKKYFLSFSTLLIASLFIFTGCPNSSNPTVNGTENGTESEFETLTNGSEITVNVGEEKTFNVENVDTFSADDGWESKATITNNDDGTFTIKGLADGTLSITFQKSDDDEGTYDKTVTLYVYDPNYTVKLTLDDELAKEASTISVYYEGKEDSESTASKSETVNATYTAGETSATVVFKKDNANSYKWFNNIAVTVKDAEENEISVSVNPTSFCYTNEEFTGLEIKKTVSSQKFTISFSGFTIKGGTVEGVKYSNTWATSSSQWTEDQITTPTVTVSDDGSSASFDIESSSLTDKQELYIDWTAVTFKNSEGNDVADSYTLSGNTAANQWYSYSDSDSLAITITGTSNDESFTSLESEKSITVETADSYTQVLEASSFANLTISKLKITISSETESAWCSISGASTWATETYTQDAINKTTYISDSTYLEAIKTNGLYIQSSAGTFVVTVEYN